MGVCDCCGHLTDRPEAYPGPYGLVVLCPLCAGLGAVAHLTCAPGPEGAGYGHGGTSGVVRR